MHRYLLRPYNLPGDRYDTMLLTQQGLRLIDVGISVLQRQVGESFSRAYVQRELEELELFRTFFLGRQVVLRLKNYILHRNATKKASANT